MHNVLVFVAVVTICCSTCPVRAVSDLLSVIKEDLRRNNDDYLEPRSPSSLRVPSENVALTPSITPSPKFLGKEPFPIRDSAPRNNDIEEKVSINKSPTSTKPTDAPQPNNFEASTTWYGILTSLQNNLKTMPVTIAAPTITLATNKNLSMPDKSFYVKTASPKDVSKFKESFTDSLETIESTTEIVHRRRGNVKQKVSPMRAQRIEKKRSQPHGAKERKRAEAYDEENLEVLRQKYGPKGKKWAEAFGEVNQETLRKNHGARKKWVDESDEENLDALRQKLLDGLPPAQPPPADLLDMAPASGARVHQMRMRNRLCHRSILLPEGPKYDSEGKIYVPRFKPRGRVRFEKTVPPRLLLPRCCNCCRKSVLGCE